MTDSTTPDGASEGFPDTVEASEESKQTVTNDAVAGETVLPETNESREGRDHGTGDGDEDTRAPSEADTASPDPLVPPGPDAPSDASQPVGPEEPLDLRDEDN